MDYNYVTEISYAINSLPFIVANLDTFEYPEQILDKHERDMKRLLLFYRELKRENEQVLYELDQECQEQISADMAYALKFLSEYDGRVDMRRLCNAMDDAVFLYGLTAIMEKALVLVRHCAPKKGELYYEIVRECFCSNVRRTDECVMEMLPGWISRRQYYRDKKDAVRLMGYYFFEIVIPRVQKEGGKTSFTH